MEKLSGQTLSRKIFLREKIYTGALSDVYRAFDQQRGVEVATKVLKQEYYRDSEHLNMFLLQAEIHQSITHDNVVRLFDIGKDGETIYIVLEWIEGCTLKQKITRNNGKPLHPEETLTYIKPICAAVQYMNSDRHLVHCDLKPSNILIRDKDNRVFLNDFGIACPVGGTQTGGTPTYMAPEQFMGRRVTPRTDVYAAGVTVYEMLSGGKVLFDGNSPENPIKSHVLRERVKWEIDNLPFPPIRRYNKSISDSIEDAVARAVKNADGQRYDSMANFASGLNEAVNPTKTTQFIRVPPEMTDHTKVLADKVTKTIRKTIDDQIRFAGGLLPKSNSAVEVASLPTGYRGWYLIGVQGSKRGKYFLLNRKTITVGRSTACDIRYTGVSDISRAHALIVVDRQGGISIKDTNSKNGVWVNGRRISRATRISNGFQISFGGSNTFELRIRTIRGLYEEGG